MTPDRRTPPAATILLWSAEEQAVAPVAAQLVGTGEISFLRPLEERAATPWSLLRLLRGAEAEVFAIAVNDVRPDRHPRFIRAVLAGLALLPRAKRRLLIDEGGRTVSCTPARFFLLEGPLLAVRLAASLLLVIVSYLLLLPLQVVLQRRTTAARP